MQWTSQCVPWQIDFVGVLFAPARFFVFVFGVFAVCFAVSADETQVWLGDLRIVVFFWFLWFLCVVFSICLLKWTCYVLVQTSFLQLMLM